MFFFLPKLSHFINFFYYLFKPNILLLYRKAYKCIKSCFLKRLKKLCYHDIDSKALYLTFKACKSAIGNKNLDYKLEATTDKQEALKDANSNINSISLILYFK